MQSFHFFVFTYEFWIFLPVTLACNEQVNDITYACNFKYIIYTEGRIYICGDPYQ
jgi:hypothetical protein